MQKVLSPKQVARALEVSESSVKRWCDQGVIAATYTGGGHRRITLDALVDFVRSSKRRLADPAAIGLPPGTVTSADGLDVAASGMQAALAAGNEFECRRIVHGLYMAETAIATICDDVISPAVNALGLEWETGHLEVYQERRACEIVTRLTHELSSLIRPAATDAPKAIGGGIEGDPYSLASRMVALVLKDAGWNAHSLGPNVPLSSYSEAIRAERPRLFWLSIRHLEDEAAFIKQYNDIFDEFSAQVAFVVGGQAIDQGIRKQTKYASFCDTMQHMEQFASALLAQSSAN